MHRSGTSLVAGLLQRHGLWLGADADLMPPDPNNPEGYYEHLRLVRVNDEILERFGGDWIRPPALVDSWHEDPRLDGLQAPAASVAAEAAGRRWGFKDPRASLTLPFWRACFGHLELIVCLRNPLEVARSLQHRNGIPLAAGIELWRRYYGDVLAQSSPADRVVVDFESFCAEPIASAASLLERVPGLRPLNVRSTRTFVRTTLHHHRAEIAELSALGAPSEVVEMYAGLRGEAVHLAAPEPAPGESHQLDAALAGWDLALRSVHMDLIEVAAKVARIEIELGFARSADLAGIAAALDLQANRQLPGLASAVEQVGQILVPLDERIAALQAALAPQPNGHHS